jgi:acyl dehydratase
VRQFAGNDPARFRGIKARFSKHVFPGETIVVECWADPATRAARDGVRRVLFQCRVAERGGELVLSNGVAEVLGAPSSKL